MNRFVLQALVLCLAISQAAPAFAEPSEFSFVVIAHGRATNADDNSSVQSSIEETDSDNLAFVVMQGIKPANIACTDKVYLRQRSIVDSARNGVIISITASDWSRCPSESGKSSSVGRLGR